ncbi:MAG TPA: sigma-70 family RNA polymerase sigma factor [Planctomycetota bacterium]
MSRPLHLEHELHRHGDALRALAGLLVRDPNLADDAVQEVWLAALQRPPGHRESVGGWFATALHNVLRMWRRTERRREQREEIVRNARGGGDSGDAVAREERGRQLLTAVESLEQPFRDAIWQRFFEGKAPREIAAASGVPVATVKSRLQRGLGMLRTRLAKHGGDDWRAGFAAAFAFGKEGAIAVTAVATGGVVMATWTKVTAGVIAVAAALAVWTSWPGADAPELPASTGRQAAAIVSVPFGEPAPTTAGVASRADAAPERGAAPASARPDPKLATIRGRCVDEQGKPVPGCNAQLSGWQSSRDRVDAWLRDHPEPDWENPQPLITAADGAFAFTFWPPPPLQFAIHVVRDDLAAIGARWHTIAEGRAIDLGDIVMVPGVRVQGRVVDDAGNPIANASVRVDVGVVDSGNSETPSFRDAQASTLRDGTFRCRSVVRPGPYHVHVSAPDGRERPHPFSGTLTRDRPVEDIVLVLPRPAAGPTITGRVVDETGQPIRDVSLAADDQENGHTTTTRTRRDGTFTLKKNVTGAGGSVALRATHPTFEPARPERTWAWGSTDIVVTMHRAGGLAVYVRDEDGESITDFTVRVVKRSPLSWSSSDADVRTRGPHAAGFAAVPGIPRGSWTLVVEFPTAMQRVSVVVPIEKTANDTLRVDVTARADAQRTIRVVDTKGEPLAGTRLQLCLPVEGEFGEETYVRPLDRVFDVHSSAPMSRALLLMEGATTADGSLVVTGPRRQPLGIRVCGPGHVPAHRGGVLLDDEAPLVIAVEKGARLHGALHPAEVIPALQRLTDKQRLELRLHAAGSQQRTLPSRFEPGFPVAADGSFDCAGIEPGEWKVVLVDAWVPLGDVTLRSGESTRLDPDLSELLTGTLRGTLHKNGRPLADMTFQICGKVTGPFAYVNAKTGAAGRFEVQVGTGAYQAVLGGLDRAGNAFEWRSLENATVAAGQTTQQEFHVWTAELAVIVRDASGAPVPKLQVRVTRADRAHIDWLRPTDANGAIDAELDAGTVAFAVLPKRLLSLEAQQKAREAASATGAGDPIGAMFMTVGTATLVTGKTTTVELRLPPEWESR